MNRRFARALTVCALAGAVAHAFASRVQAVPIPDKALEAALRAMVFDKRDKTDELTEDDLKKIYVLEARGKGIKDLTGIDKCTNLLQVVFPKNEIVDVSPLKELKNIQSLDLAQNKIVDAAPIGELTALQFLELSDNQIASVEPLAKLEKLSALYIGGNRISDPAPLSALTRLSSLDLSRNQIGDINRLTNLGGLSNLNLNDNHISDLAPLAKPLSIKILQLEKNKIADLSQLVAAVKADADGEKRYAPYLRLYLAVNPLCADDQKKQLDALKAAGVKVNLGEKEK